MKTLHRRCAGLDVHSDTVVACARLTARTKASHEVRRFSTATRDLLDLADWLAGHSVTHVAISPDGQTLLTVSAPQPGQSEVRLWDAATGKPLTEPLPLTEFGMAVDRVRAGQEVKWHIRP